MRVFLLGCGTIGRTLAQAAEGMDRVEETIIFDKYPERVMDFISSLTKACVTDSLDHMADADLVVEAASQEAALTAVPLALSMGKDVMVMSVGAFVDDDFRERCRDLALEHGGRIMVPSGAISGADGLHSAAAGGLRKVELTTIKGPRSLKNIPYLEEKGVDVDSFDEVTVLFRGSAREAVRNFPRNVNVSATISLLGLGFDDTIVTIAVDPDTEENRHILEAEGDFGSLLAETRNVPFPDNPATSYLAALSAVAALRRAVYNEWVGI